MKVTKTVTVDKEEVIAVICDKCKKEYGDPMEIQEFLHIDFIGGYASVFGEGHGVEADICQHCLKKIGKSFLRVTMTSAWF